MKEKLSKVAPRLAAGSKAMHVQRQIREGMLALIAIATVIAIGTAGYCAIEGWNWFDSLYMTVITLTTVGYGETHHLSDAGRMFTIVLIVIGVGVVMYVLTALARIAIEQQILWLFERRGMQEKIDKLRGHTIFCGYGRLSQIAIAQLCDSGVPLVVIEQNPTKADTAREGGCYVVQGDATVDDTLIAAGVERAERVVTLLSKDADNLYVVLTSTELNPDLLIVSRAEDEVGEKRLKRAGADRIISPYRVGGQKIADGLMRPFVTEFLDIAASSSGGNLAIEEILIPENSGLHGMTLRDSGIRQRTNVIIAAVISKNGKMVANPSGDTIIESGTTLIGLGDRQELIALEKLLHDLEQQAS